MPSALRAELAAFCARTGRTLASVLAEGARLVLDREARQGAQAVLGGVAMLDERDGFEVLTPPARSA